MFEKKKKFRFNWNLAQRFVNDYRLPIPIMGERMFKYHLNLYENKFGCKSKWLQLWDLIDQRFGGNPEKFLEEFYRIREQVIQTVSTSEPFIAFNNCDMGVYPKVKLAPRCSSLYNEMNIGKKFVSIDLTKGNFQALNYVDRNILLNSGTYEEFISKFTDLYYIKESKYFRQVIFGKMNPKRHITVEEHLIGKVYNYIIERGVDPSTLVVANSDELIFEITDAATEFPVNEVGIALRVGANVHIEEFTLRGYDFYSKKENHKRCTFYAKERRYASFKNAKSVELMCVPMPYHSIIFKLYHGIRPKKKDYHFVYENIDCIFNDKFYIKEIN